MNLARVNAAACSAVQTRFTALLHHVDVEALERAFRRQKRQASAGVDGITVAAYEQNLEANLRALCSRATDLREVVNAILYLASSGCAWSLLPREFPPYTTVQRYFYDWRDVACCAGSAAISPWQHRNRKAAGRARPPASSKAKASRPPKAVASGALMPARGIKGRKRHFVTDTLGLMVGLVVHAADIQDRDGAVPVLVLIRHRYPWLRHVFADGGYAGDKLKGRLAQNRQVDDPDHQALRSRQELRGPAASMGRGANLRLACSYMA